jgi:hypothetical protein
VKTKQDYPTKDKFFGEKFGGLKGKDAVNKLLQEKRGYVPNAFYKTEIGYITLVWGDEDGGLCHIIKKREEVGTDIENFLENITEVIEKGNLHKDKNNSSRWNIWYDKKLVVIETFYLSEKLNWVISAYKQRKENKET